MGEEYLKRNRNEVYIFLKKRRYNFFYKALAFGVYMYNS